jgi:hypothetical protein
MLRASLLSLALFLCACSSDSDRDTGIGGNDASNPADAGEEDALPEKDGSIFVVHDAGGPLSCSVTCDCPQGLACVDSECVSLGTPVWCCDKQGCPRGQQCLGANDQPDTCQGDPDPADGGVRPDMGPGQIGDYCEMDGDCDQTMGFSCWERFEPPYIWGYCTLVDCVPMCPTGSECIRFTGPPEVIGCMEACQVEAECNSDAFCFPIPNAGFGVCIPDCRDDFYDCSPRDGTKYCNPATGLWIPDCDFTPSHDNSALIGDPCINSTQCADGDVCLGEFAWNFADGMCTHVCDGLAEATACPSGSTCQYLPPPNDTLGLCFRDCNAGACPDRIGATCDLFDASWLDPSCIPPINP